MPDVLTDTVNKRPLLAWQKFQSKSALSGVMVYWMASDCMIIVTAGHPVLFLTSFQWCDAQGCFPFLDQCKGELSAHDPAKGTWVGRIWIIFHRLMSEFILVESEIDVLSGCTVFYGMTRTCPLLTGFNGSMTIRRPRVLARQPDHVVRIAVRRIRKRSDEWLKMLIV